MKLFPREMIEPRQSGPSSNSAQVSVRATTVFFSVTDPLGSLNIPPPPVDRLSAMEQLESVSVPKFQIAPPLPPTAVPVIVLFVIAMTPWLQIPPPPESKLPPPRELSEMSTVP